MLTVCIHFVLGSATSCCGTSRARGSRAASLAYYQLFPYQSTKGETTRITDLTVMLLSPEWARVPLPEQCVVLPFVLAPTRAIQTKHALAGEPAQLVPEGLDPSPHPPLP